MRNRARSTCAGFTIRSSSKSEDFFFKHLYRPYDPDYIEKNYGNLEPGSNRRYSLGDGQSAPAAAAFANPLEVTAKPDGGIPAPGVRVDFVAPSSGPHGVFANGLRSISVLTDRSGKAQATCSASCQAGAYTVTATALGSTAQVRFTLTNTSSRKRCTTVVLPR